MKKALLVAREHDKDTDVYSVLDMIGFDLTDDPEKIKEFLLVSVLPLILQVNDKHSEICSITIEFDEKEPG